MATEPTKFDVFESNAPVLFLLGGLLYGIGTLGLIYTTYTGTSVGVDTTFAALGKVLVPLGLLGLYPSLVTHRPYLSRAAAVVALIPAACWSLAFIGGGILEPAGIVSGAPGPLALAPFVGFIGLYVAFALFGIAALLAAVHPKSLVGLLLVYPAMFPLWMTVLSGVPDFLSGVFGVLIFAAIGMVLKNTDLPSTETEIRAESTA